ncbi:MAG: futalosine hydrolase [Chitinophagaceae bacterium]
MYLLLTAATTAEIQPVIDFLEKRDFTLQILHAEILVTGIGAVSTTYLLTDSINKRRPDIIIQAGIAGSFGQKKTGEVVTVERDAFGDMGAWEKDQFKNIFDLNLVDDNQPPFINRFLINPFQKLLLLSGLEQVRAITVNEISTESKRIAWYKQNLSPAVESMEGAALHYVCLRENIPFLQIRSVSNAIGERDKTKWNLPEAIGKLNEELILLLNELSQYNETYFRI